MNISFENNGTAEIYGSPASSYGIPENVVNMVDTRVDQLRFCADEEEIKSKPALEFDGESVALQDGYRMKIEVGKYHVGIGEIFKK